MTSEADLRPDLASEVWTRYRHANIGAMAWSTAYHATGALSILASAAAAFIAAASPSELPGTQASWIAALSGLAATFTAISTFAGFQRKWRTNRTTRTALFKLRMHLKSEGETPDLLEQFCQIMDDHDRGIDGAEAG